MPRTLSSKYRTLSSKCHELYQINATNINHLALSFVYTLSSKRHELDHLNISRTLSSKYRTLSSKRHELYQLTATNIYHPTLSSKSTITSESHELYHQKTALYHANVTNSINWMPQISNICGCDLNILLKKKCIRTSYASTKSGMAAAAEKMSRTLSSKCNELHDLALFSTRTHFSCASQKSGVAVAADKCHERYISMKSTI